MRFNSAVIIPATTQTGTVTSVTVDAGYIMTGSIQAVFSSGTATGTLTLQGSNDDETSLLHDPNGKPIPVNWNTVANGSLTASAAVASGATTTISMQWLNYRWLRAQFVSSGGTGTITVTGLFQGQ